MGGFMKSLQEIHSDDGRYHCCISWLHMFYLVVKTIEILVLLVLGGIARAFRTKSILLVSRPFILEHAFENLILLRSAFIERLNIPLGTVAPFRGSDVLLVFNNIHFYKRRRYFISCFENSLKFFLKSQIIIASVSKVRHQVDYRCGACQYQVCNPTEWYDNMASLSNMALCFSAIIVKEEWISTVRVFFQKIQSIWMFRYFQEIKQIFTRTDFR